MKPREVLFLEWIDSSSPSESTWMMLSDIDNKPLTIYTVGWVLYEDESAITVGMSLQKENDLISEHITIPKFAIIKKKTLKLR